MDGAMPLPVAIKQFCKLEHESTSDFIKEYKKLSTADKEWFRQAFAEQNIAVRA